MSFWKSLRRPFSPAPRGRSARRPEQGRRRLAIEPLEGRLAPAVGAFNFPSQAQPGGASATLRRLVEAASRNAPARLRATHEAVYRVLSALAGDLPAFENATRALFANDADALAAAMAGWPSDVRTYVARLSSAGSPSA